MSGTAHFGHGRHTKRAEFGMVLYNDAWARVRVRPIYEQIHRWLAADTPRETSWWRFGRLRDPEIATAATAVFLRADMLVLVGYDEIPLPPEVRWWMSLCPPHPNPDGRSVLVYVEFRESETDAPSDTETFLHAAAGAMGLAFQPCHVHEERSRPHGEDWEFISTRRRFLGIED